MFFKNILYFFVCQSWVDIIFGPLFFFNPGVKGIFCGILGIIPKIGRVEYIGSLFTVLFFGASQERRKKETKKLRYFDVASLFLFILWILLLNLMSH